MSLLCQKKDIIIQKFDELLKKLGGEELSANITMGRVTKEWKEAMEVRHARPCRGEVAASFNHIARAARAAALSSSPHAVLCCRACRILVYNAGADGARTSQSWLQSESTYRLTVEKAKEAKQGAGFAENEFEKWKDANKQAKQDLEVTLARHAQERLELADERKIIKMIMRYIGVLHDVKATEKSIAAGGVDSVKDKDSGTEFVCFCHRSRCALQGPLFLLMS